ncbi:MAG: adenylate/guanylate cyclase domain-containing protein [Spirochaetales bacterium]|nr:adenylate/guanylate cyclase domain-containing protein [Spirochaetales bacterium]
MDNTTKSKIHIFLHIVEIFYALSVLTWYVLPYYLPGLFQVKSFDLPFLIYIKGGEFHMLVIASILTFLIPVICGLKLISVFFRKKMAFLCAAERFFPILFNIISSACLVVLIFLYIQAYAINIRFFQTFSLYTYILGGFSIIYNVSFSVFLVKFFRKVNENYQEYLEFRRLSRKDEDASVKIGIKVGIQQKLLVSFLGLIFILLLGLSSILMVDFSNTVLASVFDTGNTLAGRSAMVIKTNIDDDIAINDYLAMEKARNNSSEFRFNSLSFYKKQGKTENYVIAVSTDTEILGNELDPSYASITETQARYNSKMKTYEFISPVFLSNRIIGYALAVYAEDAVFEAYFRTQVKVIIFSFIFMYLAIILVYIFGSRIVFPLLFLRMNVNKLGTTLSRMLKGKMKVSADLLTYRDIVKTKDEIKTLSTEINDMTNVIKGVIPYISSSTFTHVEEGKPVSQIRKLCFLFTDIRGFTTLCEGLAPAKVVSILNRYLDIQSTIIMNNHGDIDKFVGDEIMGTFDGPDKEKNACKASMEIRTAMAEEREKREKKQQKAVQIGIGLNSGPVVFGSVGAKERMDFTSIGDTVNLAARLEGANKVYHTKALMTETVYTKVKDLYICREIDLIAVKGKSIPVRIYEILQDKKKADKKLLTIKKYFEEGLEQYRNKKWNDALKVFTKCNEEYNDRTSNVFIRRIGLFKSNPPPANWDGVFTMTVK